MIHFISGQTGLPSSTFDTATIDEAVEYCRERSVLGVDTETEGQFDHSNSMIMFQIGDEYNQYVIDTRSVSIEPFRDILEDPNTVKIFWNAKFDHKFIKKEGIELENIYDGFLAEKALYNGIRSRDLSLEGAARNYLGVQLDKTQRGQFSNMDPSEPFTDKQIKYGAEDVEFLIRIREYQLEELERWDLVPESKLENRYILAHADMEYYGININVESWLELENTKQEEFEKAEKALDNYVIRYDLKPFIESQMDLFDGETKTTIKWSSEQQVADLCDHIGLDTHIEDPKTGKLKRTTQEDHILKFKDQFPEFVSLLLDFREKKKQVENYGKNFLLHVNKRTGRIHSDFFPFINTGRISSNSPNENWATA